MLLKPFRDMEILDWQKVASTVLIFFFINCDPAVNPSKEKFSYDLTILLFYNNIPENLILRLCPSPL